MATAQPLPTPASLAADCAALIAELQSAQARLWMMDGANGVFEQPPAQAGAQPQAGAGAQPQAGAGVQPQAGTEAQGTAVAAPSNDFIVELATRFENVNHRLNQTARSVRDLLDGGFVATGFPSGLTKIPPP